MRSKDPRWENWGKRGKQRTESRKGGEEAKTTNLHESDAQFTDIFDQKATGGRVRNIKSLEMNKETKARVASAFRAMKALGISGEKVKPVLKNLLKLYENNWALIEEENYRTLADGIFDKEEQEAEQHSEKTVNNDVAEQSKKIVNAEAEEAQVPEEPELPRKRLRIMSRDGQTSSNLANSSLAKPPFIKPKEPDEIPKTHPRKINGSQSKVDPPMPNAQNTMSQSLEKGKQPVSSKSLILHESLDLSQPNGNGKSPQNNQFRSVSGQQSHSMRMRERRSKTGSPQVLSLEDRPATKIDPVIPLASGKPNTEIPAIVVTKDEPMVTDDAASLEVRDVIIHPVASNGGDASCRQGMVRENCYPEPSTIQSAGEQETADGATFPRESRSYGGLAVVSSNPPSNLEVASSPSGEVKFYFSYDPASRKSDFQMPTLEAVLKSVEDKCLRSPKTSDLYISMMDLLKEMCKCFLTLGTDSIRQSPKFMDLTPTIDSVSKSSAVYYRTRSKASQAPKPALPVIDIARGQEKVVITIVNDVNDEPPPSFFYIPKNAAFQNAYVNFSLARIGDKNSCGSCAEDCLSLSIPCACAYETGGYFAYTPDGLVKEELLEEVISMNHDPKKHCQFFCKECPLERSKCEDVIEPCKGHLVRKFIKECWWKCGCNQQCGNRVVQRGISCNLQVFMTPGGKGWGLRTLECLPKGAFVCEYVGEVLTNSELFDRVSQSPKGEKHSYPVLLDADWCAEGVLKDEEALCLDATYYGNVARFINHRCYDSTLVEIPVEVETPDHHYYHLAFFTTRKVKAMEELTWDYGIDFDDHEHPIKAFNCQCGSKYCRNIKHPRTRASRR